MSDLETYTGWVRAKEPCYFDGMRFSAGDFFTVTAEPLWSDDPYLPVVLMPTAPREAQACAANTEATVHAAGTRLPGL